MLARALLKVGDVATVGADGRVVIVEQDSAGVGREAQLLGTGAGDERLAEDLARAIRGVGLVVEQRHALGVEGRVSGGLLGVGQTAGLACQQP